MKRLPYIDVLRAVAILSVVAHHVPPDFGSAFGALQTFGGRGVDLFFILSGFLIGSTALARAETGASPRNQSMAYWLLRVMRIWPLYFLLLGLYALGVPAFDSEVGRIVREQARFYLFFFSNELGQPTLELGILWSLAIEEQFYLVIGLVVIIASKRRETLAAAFVSLGVVTVLVALKTRFDLVNLHNARVLDDSSFTFRLYFNTFSRIDQLGLGLMTAVFAPRLNVMAIMQSRRWVTLSSWLAIALLLAVLLFLPQSARFEFLVIGVLFAAVVVWVQRPATWDHAKQMPLLERWLVKVLGNIGKVSFGFYLFHPFVRGWVLSAMPGLGLGEGVEHHRRFLLVWVLATWALAYASYRLIEEPLLRWARSRATKLVAMPA